MNIAIIPAKATSIRLPGKNTSLLGGIELYRHSVRYATKEGFTPVVSTDSAAVLDECRRDGILTCEEVVDDSNICNCINQVLQKYDCNYFALLQPSSPIREHGLLRRLVETKPTTSIYTARKVKIIGHIGDKFHIAYRDQDSDTKFLYQFDGNIVLVNAAWYKESRSLFCDASRPYVQNMPYSLQIDDRNDYDTLNILYNFKHKTL